MEVPKKTSRPRKPKVRSGCLVCKSRKIKCDETKPECTRCTKFGTACTYVAKIQESTTFPRLAGFVPIKPRDAALPIAGNPSVSIPGDDFERRYFQLFREKLSGEFGGYFESPFWTYLIPQECHREPAVRHAIFALSALWKSSASRDKAIVSKDEHLTFALEQHSKAISSFRRSLSAGRFQVRLALMASLLLGCFESFHGNWDTAYHQIQGGLNLLKQWQKSQSRKTSVSNAPQFDPELGRTLSRLQLQMDSYLAVYPMNDDPSMEIQDIDLVYEMATRFANIKEVFNSALKISSNSFRLIRRAYRSRNDKNLEIAVAKAREILREAVSNWRKAIRPLYLEIEIGHNFELRDRIGVIQMDTTMLTFDIMLATALARNEMVFDRFTEQFRRIIARVRRIFNLVQEYQESRGQDGLRAQFGMGMVMTLYLTATRCRDHVIRWDAISILRGWPVKNGIWDSLQAATVAEWIVNLEEDGYEKNDHIPEEARVRMSSVKVVSRYTSIDVECLQGPEDEVSKSRMANLALS